MDHSWDERFRDKLLRQTSLSSAVLLLAESASELGWDLAGFHLDREQLMVPRSNDGEFVTTTMGWPAECVNAWVNKGLNQYCPVAQQCGRTTDSFAWECDPAGPEWRTRKLTHEQGEVLHFYSDYFDGAVTVPVSRLGGKSGYVSWCIRNRRNLLRRHHDTYSATYLISHSFIRHIDNLAASRREAIMGMKANALSPREIECLSWAACGKTEEAIGIIIQRSRDTVHFHLRNAVQKLNASNRTHAVAIACSRGLITVH